MRTPSKRNELRSRRELAIVAAALLLPIPLLAASGVMVPLPSAVERALVSLLPGGEVETGLDGGQPVSASPRSSAEGGRSNGSSSSSERDSAGVLSEGGNAAVPAGDGAAGGDDSSADNVLPGDERLLPGGGEPDLPAAPDTPGGSTDTPGGSSDAGDGAGPPVVGAPSGASGDEKVPALVTVSAEGVTLDTSAATADVIGPAGATVDVSPQEGVTLTVDADQDETTNGLTVTVPLPLPTVPLPLPTISLP
jgi:hypothetical protein